MAEPLKNLPEDQRPREKLLQQGAEALSDVELLAIFLRTGVKDKNVLDLAEELLTTLGGLHGLFTASQAQFNAIHGMGPAKYVQVHAVLEMSRRYLLDQIKRGDALSSPKKVRDFLSLRLKSRPHEVFAVIFLDTKNRVIAFEELFHGTIDGAGVYPREILKRVLHHNAAAVIFAHNHPSGVAEPSPTDIQFTRRLRDALGLFDVRVLDHVIVGEKWISMAERGLF